MDKKVPVPPTGKLSLPVEFWADIIKTLDFKSSEISRIYGFGEVNLKLKVWNGSVSDVIFTDEVRMRNMVDKVKDKSRLTKKNK